MESNLDNFCKIVTAAIHSSSVGDDGSIKFYHGFLVESLQSIITKVEFNAGNIKLSGLMGEKEKLENKICVTLVVTRCPTTLLKKQILATFTQYFPDVIYEKYEFKRIYLNLQKNSLIFSDLLDILEVLKIKPRDAILRVENNKGYLLFERLS